MWKKIYHLENRKIDKTEHIHGPAPLMDAIQWVQKMAYGKAEDISSPF